MRHLVWVFVATLALVACERGAPKWNIETERDALRDTNKVFVRINSNERFGPEDPKTSVNMSVMNGDVTFGWGEGIRYCTTRGVAYRFDQEEIAYLDCLNTAVPSTHGSQTFTDRIFQPSETLVLESADGQYTFDTRGLSVAIENAEASGIPS